MARPGIRLGRVRGRAPRRPGIGGTRGCTGERRRPERQCAQQHHLEARTRVRRQRQILLAHERDLVVELDVLRRDPPGQGQQPVAIRVVRRQYLGNLLDQGETMQQDDQLAEQLAELG